MFVILVLFAVPATFITIDQPAAAQDSGGALKAGLEQLRAGKTDEAIATLRKALAADPSNEDVMSALGRAEYEALLGLIASGSEGANIAKALLDRAMPVLPEKAFDEAELNGLVKTAVTSEDYSERFDAQMTLARVYGEFAVPGLVAYLSSSNTEFRIAAHIALSRRIGRDAVGPLMEALASDDAGVRRMVAAELGMIGDPRAMGALAAVAANDADDNVKQVASNSLAKLAAKVDGAGSDASALYLSLAAHYYGGDVRVMSYADRPLVLWSWGADGLASTAVPRHLYVLKHAEEAAYDALAQDSSNTAAAALLARILASEKLASDMFSKINDDDLTKAAAESLAHVTGTIAAMGGDILGQALSDCLAQGDHHAASVLLGVMPSVYRGSSDLTADHPVVRATADTSQDVRIAAARAVLMMNSTNRITAFPDPDGFMGRVAKAVGEVIPRQILVVDSNDARRNKILTALNDANYTAFDARTGSDGVVLGVRYAGLDLIIISTELGDMEALGMINRLQSEERTKDTPILVVGSAAQAADEEWGNLYREKAKSVVGIPDGPGLADEEFIKVVSGSFGGEGPGAAQRYAQSAEVLAALAHTDARNALFNWSSLTPTLTALLTADVPADPPVRQNALAAIANVGDAGAMEGLIAFFGSTDDDGLKAACGDAIAQICRQGSVTLDEGAFGALLKGAQEGADEVRKAAFSALGAAALTTEQAMMVATSTRPG